MKKNTTNNGKPQTITQIPTAAHKVNSWPQEANVFVL